MERNSKLTLTAGALAGILLTLASNAVLDVVSMPGIDAGTRLTVVPDVGAMVDAGAMELRSATATLLRESLERSGAKATRCRLGGAVNRPTEYLCSDGQGAAFLMAPRDMKALDGGATRDDFGLAVSGGRAFAK